PWVAVQATQERVDLMGDEPVMFEALRDLAAGAIRILRGSRVRAVGINHYFHYALPAMSDSLGAFVGLSSNPAWRELESPSVHALNVRAARPEDWAVVLEGYLGVQIEPSIHVKNGLFVAINDHYEITSRKDDES